MSIKPLETAAIKEKKSKRSSLIIGIILAVIMIASTIGFALLERYQGQQQAQQSTYRGYTFMKTDYGWQTILKLSNQDIIINTFYLPQEVENISSDGKPLLNEFFQKAIFIVADSYTERQAALEYNVLGNIALRMQLACSVEDQNSTFCIENNLPIKSCDDATSETKIIVLQELEENSTEEALVNYKNSCLIVKGKGSELIKANEKALFLIFNIIE